jgi:hypothetical protein
MAGWAYYVHTLNEQEESEDGTVEDFLDELGADDGHAWELVAVRPRQDGSVRYYFKKPIEGPTSMLQPSG